MRALSIMSQMMERSAQSQRNDGIRELALNGKTVEQTRVLRRSKQLPKDTIFFAANYNVRCKRIVHCRRLYHPAGPHDYSQHKQLSSFSRSARESFQYYVLAYTIVSLVFDLNKFSSCYRCPSPGKSTREHLRQRRITACIA